MEILRYGIASAIIIVLTILRQIHIIQLNSYNLDQQLIWYKKNILSFVPNVIVFISCILLYELKFVLVYYLLVIGLIILLIENLPKKQKRKLVFTARINRLIFICIVLFSIFYILTIKNNDVKFLMYAASLSPLIIFMAYLISLPIENGIRKNFMGEAHDIIKQNADLHVIGITGSFGKTSVKHYLNRILKSKYSVCMTPESYNTPMGATITIKNDLKNINDIFICEMGARRIGDIKEICDIVDPNGAIITDVGHMHLDTFKNIENVGKTKFELVDAVLNNNVNTKFGAGIILLNGDNELIRERTKAYNFGSKKKYFYGLNTDNDFYASDIEVSGNGTRFTFNSRDKSFARETFETKLLGKYNIMNLVAAIAYSLLLGVDISDAKNAVKSIEAVPHRLQVLPYNENNILIDDAYNSNPSGARNAIDVLNSFSSYTKIVITPGMVELNDKQEEENRNFSQYASDKVDYAIVVGKTNKTALIDGFSKSLDNDKIIAMDKVEDAISLALTSISGKKVILLENDLSDNY